MLVNLFLHTFSNCLQHNMHFVLQTNQKSVQKVNKHIISRYIVTIMTVGR